MVGGGVDSRDAVAKPTGTYSRRPPPATTRPGQPKSPVSKVHDEEAATAGRGDRRAGLGLDQILRLGHGPGCGRGALGLG